MTEVSQDTASRTFTMMQTLSQSITAVGLTSAVSTTSTIQEGDGGEGGITAIGNSTTTDSTGNTTISSSSSNTMTADDMMTGFPFVTMPYFHVQGHQTLIIGGADVVPERDSTRCCGL